VHTGVLRGAICSASIDLTLSDAAVPQDESYVFLQSWGNEIGVFHDPNGIAVGGDRLYVCDALADRVQVFDLYGTPLTTFGGAGDRDGEFLMPYGVAVDRSGNVYVADKYNHRVQKFTSDGTFLTKWGSEGGGAEQFNSPEGVAVDENGNIYVADTYNHRIQKFTSDGVYLTQWNGFDRPESVTVDRTGNVYVADTGNHRIQKGVRLRQGHCRGRERERLRGGLGQPSHPKVHLGWDIPPPVGE
jgi:tripartite motif-containing protein 71